MKYGRWRIGILQNFVFKNVSKFVAYKIVKLKEYFFQDNYWEIIQLPNLLFGKKLKLLSSIFENKMSEKKLSDKDILKGGFFSSIIYQY